MIVLTACSTTTETVYIEPECTVPPAPTLDAPDYDDLLIPFSYIPSDNPDYKKYDDALTELEEYEVDLVNYTLEIKTGLEEVCNDRR